jgi:YfiH family protein
MKYQGARPNPLRDEFAKSLGLKATHLAGTDLIHSHLVRAVNGPGDLPLLGKGDGIASANPELALGVTVGDCMPIWVADSRSLATAALHSGWQGTGIISAALELMAERWGTRAEDCAVILGPCIHPCCYGVPLERAIQYLDSFGPEAAREQAKGTWSLDLVAANIGLCQRAGVGALRVIDACTACSPGLSSYRRDGKNGFKRMLALVSR